MKNGRITKQLELRIKDLIVQAKSVTKVEGALGGGADKAVISAFDANYLR